MPIQLNGRLCACRELNKKITKSWKATGATPLSSIFLKKDQSKWHLSLVKVIQVRVKAFKQKKAPIRIIRIKCVGGGPCPR